MRVPVYDNLQTGIAVTNGAQVRNQDVGAIGEIGARQAAQMGQVLGNAGDALGQVVLQRQALVNEADAKRVDIETDRQVREVLKGQDGYLNQQGGNAITAYEDTRRKIADIYAHAGDALGNDDARQMWNGVAAQREATAMDMIDTHHGQQQQKYVIDTTEARIRHESEGLADSLDDPKAYDVHMGVILTEAAHMSALLGETDPVLVEQRKQAYLAAAHAGVINHLLATNQPTVAEQYLTTHAGEMGKSAVDQIKPQVHEAASASLAISAVDQFMSEATKDGYFDTEAMDKHLREIYGDDVTGLELGRHEANQRAQNWTMARAQEVKASANNVFGMLTQGKSLAAVKMTTDWLKLDNGTKLSITRQDQEQQHYQAALAQQQSEVRRVQQERDLQAAAAAIPPDKLAGISDQELVYKFGKSPSALEYARARRANIARPTGLSEEGMNHVLVAAGFKPDSAKPEDQKNAAHARYVYQSAIQARAAKLKRPLTTAELNETLNGCMRQTISIRYGLPAVPLPFSKGTFEITMFDFDRHFSPMEFRPRNIPEAEMKVVSQKMAALYANTGNPRFLPTKDNISRFYVEQYKAPSARKGAVRATK